MLVHLSHLALLSGLFLGQGGRDGEGTADSEEKSKMLRLHVDQECFLQEAVYVCRWKTDVVLSEEIVADRGQPCLLLIDNMIIVDVVSYSVVIIHQQDCHGSVRLSDAMEIRTVMACL